MSTLKKISLFYEIQITNDKFKGLKGQGLDWIIELRFIKLGHVVMARISTSRTFFKLWRTTFCFCFYMYLFKKTRSHFIVTRFDWIMSIWFSFHFAKLRGKYLTSIAVNFNGVLAVKSKSEFSTLTFNNNNANFDVETWILSDATPNWPRESSIGISFFDVTHT